MLMPVLFALETNESRILFAFDGKQELPGLLCTPGSLKTTGSYGFIMFKKRMH